MGLMIGIVACAEGLQVKGSAESLGLKTTDFGGEVDLPGDRARRVVRHLLRLDRDVSGTMTEPIVIKVHDLVVGFDRQTVLDRLSSRRARRRNPRRGRRLGRRQIGAAAHHHRASAAARRHHRGAWRRSRRGERGRAPRARAPLGRSVSAGRAVLLADRARERAIPDAREPRHLTAADGRDGARPSSKWSV